MFTKLVFSRNICDLLYLNILLERQSYPHDYICTAWGGVRWCEVACVHVLVCMRVCARVLNSIKPILISLQN